MRSFSLFILCWLLLAFATDSAAQSATRGFYSREAKPIWDRIAGSPIPVTLSAPDGRSAAIAKYVEEAREGKVILQIRGRLGVATVDLGAGVGSELLWAPESVLSFCGLQTLTRYSLRPAIREQTALIEPSSSLGLLARFNPVT